jgi:hypothetical protein
MDDWSKQRYNNVGRIRSGCILVDRILTDRIRSGRILVVGIAKMKDCVFNYSNHN